MERATGFEPATSTLARWRATNCAKPATQGDILREVLLDCKGFFAEPRSSRRALLDPHFSLAAKRPPALLAQPIECGRQRTRCAHSALPAEKNLALDERKRQNCPHSMRALGAHAATKRRPGGRPSHPGGEARIRTGGQGFAGPCLTTWPLRRMKKAERIRPGARMERATGFEPATSTLARWRATNCAKPATQGDILREVLLDCKGFFAEPRSSRRALLDPHFSLAAKRPPALLAQPIECGRQRTRCAHSALPAEKNLALDERKRQNCPHSMRALGAHAATKRRPGGRPSHPGGEARIRTGGQGFAGPCLTTWPLRRMKKAERIRPEIHGAGYGVRTRDLNLGKVARYQLR